MSLLQKGKALWAVVTRRSRQEEELSGEIEAYLELAAKEKQEQGMSAAEAWREARLELGGVEQVKEQVREVRAGRLLEETWQDVVYGLRMLAKHRGFTAVAVLTLALGVGANTALFSMVYSVLLRSLPYPDPERLVFVLADGKQGKKPLSPPDFVEFQEQVASLAEVGYVRGQWMIYLTGDGQPEVVRMRPVATNFLSVYGVQPYLGRAFQPEDDVVLPPGATANPEAPAPPGAAMISYGFWQRRFGGDPNVIGKLIQLQFEPHRIIGVTPPNFRAFLPDQEDYIADVQVWTTSGMNFRTMPRDAAFLRVIGRLKPGVTREQLQELAGRFSERQRSAHTIHRESGYELRVVPLQDELVANARTGVGVLFGAVILVLLIACTNLTNLLLARGSSHRREFAVRLALGSSRMRLIRQVLVESWLYAALGTGAGLLLAVWLMRLLRELTPRSVPRLDEIALHGPVLAFSLGVSVLAALLLGLLPAIRFSGVDALAGLRESGRGAGELGRRRQSGWLVVSQVALSVILVAGTGLLLRSLVLLLGVDAGFQPDNVLTAEMTLSSPKYPRYPSAQARVRFVRQVSERIAQLPGVQAVGLGLVVPLSRQDTGHSYASDAMAKSLAVYPPAKYRPITPDFLRAVGTRLLAGRDFTWADLERERLVVIVDETLARKAWPEEDPVGKSLRIEVWSTKGGAVHLEPLWAEVIGVAQNVRSGRLGREDIETLYLPYSLYATAELSVLVRAAGNPEALIGPANQEILAVDRDMTAFNFRRMESLVWDSVAPQRYSLTLLGAFGGSGLLLAAIGLYGVMRYSVVRRVNEIGVRMALGANPWDVIRLVLGQGIKLAAAGLLLGVAGALALTRWLENQLYQVTATDPLTFAVVVALFLLVALLACYGPARRATKVDPVVALRCE